MANSKSSSSKFSTMFASIVIPLVIVTGILVYNFVLGNGANFEGGDSSNYPLPGNYLGMMHKGGVLVPILIAAFLLVWTVFLERLFTLGAAKGKGSSRISSATFSKTFLRAISIRQSMQPTIKKAP